MIHYITMDDSSHKLRVNTEVLWKLAMQCFVDKDGQLTLISC